MADTCILCGHSLADHRKSISRNERLCYHGEFDRNPCTCRIPAAEPVSDEDTTIEEVRGRQLSERMLKRGDGEGMEASDNELGFYDIAQALRLARIYQVPDNLPFAVRIDGEYNFAPEGADIKFSFSGWMGPGIYAMAPAGDWKKKWPDLY